MTDMITSGLGHPNPNEGESTSKTRTRPDVTQAGEVNEDSLEQVVRFLVWIAQTLGLVDIDENGRLAEALRVHMTTCDTVLSPGVKADARQDSDDLHPGMRIQPGDSYRVKLEKIYVYLCCYRAHWKISPTIREIQAAMGISSTSMVGYYLQALVQRGLLTRAGHGKSRSYVPVVDGPGQIEWTGSEWFQEQKV